MSPSGKLIWIANTDGNGENGFYTVVIDSTDNVIASGTYSSTTLTVYDSTRASVKTLGNLGSYAACVLKLKSDGTFLWIAR